MRWPGLNERESAFAEGVSAAYRAHGTPLRDDTVAQVAKGLAAASNCRTDEIPSAFRILARRGEPPTHDTFAKATAELERERGLGPRPGDTLLSDYLARRGMTFNEWLASGFGAAEAYT